MQRLIVLILLIFVAAPASVLAQTPTPTQDTGFISQLNTVVAIPEAVHFHAIIQVNEQMLSGGTLTVTQDGGFRETLEIDAEQDVIGTTLDTTEIRIVLPLSDDLRVLEPLNYRWQIETTDGDSATAEGQIIIEPSGTIDWQQVGDEDFRLHWYDAEFGGRTMYDLLLPIYTLLQTHTDQEVALNFALFESDYEFCRTDEEGTLVLTAAGEYPCEVDEIQAYFRNQGLALVQRTDQSFETLQNDLTRRMVEAFYAESSAPDWFRTGIVPFYRPFGGAYELAIVQQAAERDALPDLENAPEDSAQQPLWTAQAYAFLLYLADTYGAEMPFDLARAGNFETAFERITNTPLNQVYRAFEQWLASDAPDRAVYWHPYLETTPTSTPTRTLTPIPPTATVSDETPTLTQTPTSTSIVGQEPTRIVFTPTRPDQRGTPTNTPLPPGSLPTLVATPPPATTSEDEGSGGLPCGAAALVIPAMIIGVRTRRRKA